MSREGITALRGEEAQIEYTNRDVRGGWGIQRDNVVVIHTNCRDFWPSTVVFVTIFFTVHGFSQPSLLLLAL